MKKASRDLRKKCRAHRKRHAEEGQPFNVFVRDVADLVRYFSYGGERTVQSRKAHRCHIWQQWSPQDSE